MAEIHEHTGPFLLLAGPGTGKTYRLGKRIQSLAQNGVGTDDIAVITFTEAAARHMREAISDPTKDTFTARDRQPRRICTMHSLGFDIIRQRAESLGLPPLPAVVRDQKTKELLIEDAAHLAGCPDSAKDTQRCREFGDCHRDASHKCEICDIYTRLLRRCSAVDYDEQILLACDLLQGDEALREQYQAKHLLVDEYQDINAAQWRLIRLIAAAHNEGLFVVGDDDQSIYSFRGGSPQFIRRFRNDFGDRAAVETLTHSRRCPGHIYEAAIDVLKAYDSDHCDKPPLTYEQGMGAPVVAHSVPTAAAEAHLVAQIVHAAGTKSVLVLVPSRPYASLVFEELRRNRVDVNRVQEVAGDALLSIAVLREWLDDQTHSLAFRRSLQRFVGSPDSRVPSDRARTPENRAARQAALSKVAALWKPILDAGAPSLWSVLLERRDDPLMGPAAEAFSAVLAARSGSGKDLTEALIRALGVWNKADSLLREVNDWVRALDQASKGGPTSVRISTLQGAKGLEADVVCVLGVEEGAIPSNRSDADLSEQARLMFVSMTRAKEHLHLFHARTRPQSMAKRELFKGGGAPDLRPSRFLSAISAGHRTNDYSPSPSRRRRQNSAAGR